MLKKIYRYVDILLFYLQALSESEIHWISIATTTQTPFSFSISVFSNLVTRLSRCTSCNQLIEGLSRVSEPFVLRETSYGLRETLVFDLHHYHNVNDLQWKRACAMKERKCLITFHDIATPKDILINETGSTRGFNEAIVAIVFGICMICLLFIVQLSILGIFLNHQ